MELKYKPVKTQKFDIGRIINFAKCDCKNCDFINCPKDNYCKIMKMVKYSVEEFFNENKEEIMHKSKTKRLFDYDFVTDFIDCCATFPKSVYWNNENNSYYNSIDLVTRSKTWEWGDFATRVSIYTYGTCEITTFRYYTKSHIKLAEQIQKKLIKLNDLIEMNKEKI